MSDTDSGRDFDEFAHGAWVALCRLGFLVSGDRHAAEDLAQIALTRTYLAWRRVRKDNALRYARRTLLNASVDRRRARARRPQEVFGLSMETATNASPETVVDSRDELVSLLSELTVRERQVLALRYFAELTESETAHELGVSVGTVKSTSSRAIAKLRTTTSSNGGTTGGEV